jgi:RNA polymerase sigma factor (sigma-70 family)
MSLSPSDKRRIEMQFDHFCKTVLSNEMRNIKKHNYYLQRNEKTFSELTEAEYNRLSLTDEYKCFKHLIKAAGCLLEIRDERLFDALCKLPEHKRDILIFSYWMGMNDKDISEELNMVRRTVNYLRKSSIQQIKKYLEKKIK